MRLSSFKYLVRQGWHSMVSNRLMTLASIGVLVACLMITGVAVLLSVNVGNYVDYLETFNEIEFFIDDAAPADVVENLKIQMPLAQNVSFCEYISKAAAVEDMRGWLGENGDVMNDYAGEGNDQNPLPASFRISLEDVSLMADTVQRLQAMGAYVVPAEDGTALTYNAFYRINSPTELSSTLVNLRRIVSYVGWGLVIVLGVVSVVVISNTIRLTVFARRKEINIMKFVGATNAFIRLPFFVEGMTVGAISALVATGIVGGAYYGLEQALLQPNALWLSEFTRCMLPFYDVLGPLAGGFELFGIAIGGIGCASSIRKHLKV
ncbi:MAG: ABC transporter permease [Subdoligranulum sp.]|nr:ABC transporter permease [Subdoligranulum sp.]MBD5102558.1 ABC transporter permease [Subdoligranulum sp.]